MLCALEVKSAADPWNVDVGLARCLKCIGNLTIAPLMKDIKPVRISVFTPTFNRAHTLRRVYESLCRQPHHLFEWLVVDDGSTDETPELLDELSKSAPFPVRVIRQPNGGKHRAHNAAVKVAHGELMVILDSDDELTPGALDVLLTEWDTIPPEDRASFAGIVGHSISPLNTIVGSRYPAQHIDGKHFELAASGIMVGDKLPCYRSDVLKDFPLPERPGCNGYVPEGTVWAKIGTKFKVRCIDKDLRIYHSDSSDPLSLMNSYKHPDSNAWGSMQYCLVILNLSAEYWPRFFIVFVKTSVNCTRYSLHSRSGWFHPLTRLDGLLPRILWAVGFPLGVAVWAADKTRLWVRE